MLRRPRLPQLVCLVVAIATVVVTSPPGNATWTWRWPTPGGKADLIRPFQAPLGPYGNGHRGVDLQVAVGQKISAPAPGVVSFNAQVARTGTLVLDHGDGLRSTYQPIISILAVGERVKAGDVIGVIAKTSGHCLDRTCLHWGVRNTAGYLDPVKLFHLTNPVLLPLLS